MAIQREVDLETFLGAVVGGQGWRPARVKAINALIKRAPRPPQDEDCLYLTVRSPDLTPAKKLPVMVWIHGGDHQDGSGSDVYYASNALAKRHVVTVSINYRLGLMGYFAHPELAEESDHGVAGNYGTLDQIAALEWVRDNISAFGGDPDNVTIFGESAGGESVMHLMTSPLAAGLFHKAIAQSPANGGQMLHLDQPFLAYDSALDQGTALCDRLGLHGEAQLSKLRAMSAEEINAAAVEHGPGGGFYPAIDGHVLPQSPLAAFAAGAQAPVPFVIGSNTDEGTALLGSLFAGPMAEYRHLDAPTTTLPPETAEAFGSDIDELVRIYPGLDRRDLAAEVDFVGDHMFGARAYHYATHHQLAGHPTWLYMFARTPPSPQQTLGAYHAAELPFVHGSNVPIFPLTAEDKKLSSEMTRYWTNVAHAGTPNPGKVEWPAFEANDPHWLRLDHTVVHEPVDRLDQYRIFNARTSRLVHEMNGTVQAS
jgi:para-nitrobenzyl esterase